MGSQFWQVFQTGSKFYISVLKKRKQPPLNFLPSRKAREIEAANQAKHQAHQRQMPSKRPEGEERRNLNARIAAVTPEVRQALFDQAGKKLLQAHPKWDFGHYVNTNPEALSEEGPVYGPDETDAQRRLDFPPTNNRRSSASSAGTTPAPTPARRPIPADSFVSREAAGGLPSIRMSRSAITRAATGFS